MEWRSYVCGSAVVASCPTRKKNKEGRDKEENQRKKEKKASDSPRKNRVEGGGMETGQTCAGANVGGSIVHDRTTRARLAQFSAGAPGIKNSELFLLTIVISSVFGPSTSTINFRTSSSGFLSGLQLQTSRRPEFKFLVWAAKK